MMSLPVWLPSPMFLWGGGGFSVPGPMSLGEGVCPGVSLGKPPESEKRAVRILLECFLVNFCFQFTN